MSTYSHSENVNPDEQPVALVVDDMPAICRLMAVIFREAGYKVSTASTGGGALGLARELAHVDLLVTDVDMPGMHGDELARHFREIHPEAGVMFVSGGQRHIDGPQPFVFVPKPFLIEDLLDGAREALRTRPSLHVYSSAA